MDRLKVLIKCVQNTQHSNRDNYRWHKGDQPHDYSQHDVDNNAEEGSDDRVELTTYTESFFNVCKQMVLGLQVGVFTFYLNLKVALQMTTTNKFCFIK